jgi:hypothetical protein
LKILELSIHRITNATNRSAILYVVFLVFGLEIHMRGKHVRSQIQSVVNHSWESATMEPPFPERFAGSNEDVLILQ